ASSACARGPAADGCPRPAPAAARAQRRTADLASTSPASAAGSSVSVGRAGESPGGGRSEARTSCRSRAAAVRASDHLEEVAVRILEVHAAAAVVAIDLAGPALHRVGPVLEAALSDAAVHVVEVVFADQERVVLVCDLAVRVVEVERHVVVDVDDVERS